MEHQDQNPVTDKVLAFDTLFCTNHIKMLKVLLFFLDSSMQKFLAVYIKIQELQYIISYFDTHSSIKPDNFDFNLLCQEIIPYCGPEERKKIEQFTQLQQMMEQFNQINQTMEMMKELFPDGMPDFNFNSESDNSQMYDMLSAMMGSFNDNE